MAKFDIDAALAAGMKREEVDAFMRANNLEPLKSTIKEAIFPYKDPQLKIAGKDINLAGPPHAADLLSAFSLPGRALASTPTLIPGGESFTEALGRTGAKPGTGFVASLPDAILRDPALLPSMATGAEALNLAKAAGVASKPIRAIAKGATEGITSAGIHSAESVAKGEQPDKLSGLTEILMSAAVPGGASLAKPFNNKIYTKLASELGGVSEKTLKTASTKTGRAALKDAAGKQQEVGQKILQDLENIDSVMPERAEISKALSNMFYVPTSVISVLESAKVKNAVGKAKKANDDIDKLIADIKNEATLLQGKYVLPDGNTLRNIRLQLDAEIGDQFGKASTHYINALKKGRHAIAQDLVDAAKNRAPQYAPLMQSYADKIQKVDKLLGYLGITPESRERRIESFTANLFNKNKKSAQGALKDVGDILGKDYLKQIELSDMAAEFGPEGVAPWLPVQTTGRSLAGIVGSPVGSPKIATRLVMPALDREQGTPTASFLMQLLRSGTYRPDGTEE